MTHQLNIQGLYETLRKPDYRGAIQEVARQTSCSRQWIYTVLSGRAAQSPSVFKVIEVALEVKAKYDNQIAAKKAEIEKMNNAIAMATA